MLPLSGLQASGACWAKWHNFFQISNFDSLQLCSQLTYRDPQYLFGKISTSLIYRVSIQRTSRISNTSYALSKWPHFHRAYVLGGCIFFSAAVDLCFWQIYSCFDCCKLRDYLGTAIVNTILFIFNFVKYLVWMDKSVSTYCRRPISN